MKSPKIRWPSWGVLWLAVVLGVTAFPALATSSKASKTVLVYETIGQPPSYPLSFKAYTSSLGYTPDSGLSFNLAAAQEQNIAASGIVQAPVVPAVDGSGNPLSQSALLSSANASFAQYALPLASQLSVYMTSAGAGSAIFNFQQQVMVQGNSHPMYLTWQEIVDSSGRPRYGNAQLIPTAPNFVYADYTSKAVAAALPPSFAYPQAGTIQWQQVNQQMAPVTAMQIINVNGAFDAPSAVSTATTYPAGCTANATGQVGCDPDYGLKCLINHASDPYTPASPNPANPSDTGCPAVPINGYTDFISMENANGASGGYVDYVRTLTPVYTTSTDANGNTIQTAAVTVSVDTRTWSQNGYTNCNYGQYVINLVDNNGNAILPPTSGFAITNAFAFNGGGASPWLVYETGIYNSYSDGNGGYVTNYSIYPASNTSDLYAEMYQCQDTSGAYHYFMNNGTGIVNYSNNGNPASFPEITGALSCPPTGATCSGIQSPFSFSEFSISIITPYDIWNDPLSPVLLFTPAGSQTFIVTYPSIYATNLSYWGWLTYGDYAVSPVNIDTTTGGTYTNTGRIGYEVQSMVNRYYVTPDGNYYLIGNVSNNTIAPTQNYTKTVSLPSGASAAGYAYIIIDPFNTTQTYDYRNDTVNQLPAANYIYVAPIVTNYAN